MIRSDTPTAFITIPGYLHVHVAICPRTENGSYVGCSTSRSRQSRHKKQMDCIKSWFELENSRWERILSSPQKLNKVFSKRLDADKLVFSPKLNQLQMNALQSAQNSDSFRLQQLLYQSIRNLEASLVEKRRALGAQHGGRFVSRLLGHRQSRARQLVAKIGTSVDRRSLCRFNPSCSNSSANTERFANAIPKSTDFRPMRIEVLNINCFHIAPCFLFDYQFDELLS